MAGYLFVHFVGEEKDGEQVYYSLSRDGLHWEDLNKGEPVLYSHIGERGVRDPFILRDPINKKYYLIATDLRIEAGKGWEAAKYNGSRNLIIWESEDLIHWGRERSVEIGVKGAGCVWAPEAIYDEEEGAFLVFFASMIKSPEDEAPKQRIYAAYTKDFKKFTDPFVYMDRDNHVIDTTIVFDGKKYYRFTKDETTKKILMETGNTLSTEDFIHIKSELLDNIFGVEGPEIYQLPDKSWCLILDRFAEGKGYMPLISENLSEGEFRILAEGEYNLGKSKKRHGGVLRLTEEEFEKLYEEYYIG